LPDPFIKKDYLNFWNLILNSIIKNERFFWMITTYEGINVGISIHTKICTTYNTVE